MDKLEFEEKLTKRYLGKVTISPTTRYVNERAVLLFHCEKCLMDFYGKPMFMIGKDPQTHVCSMPYADYKGTRLGSVSGKNRNNKRVKNTVKETLREDLDRLIKQGVHFNQIVKETGITPLLVQMYIDTNGEMK